LEEGHLNARRHLESWRSETVLLPFVSKPAARDSVMVNGP
jgi:hypothetical protein